MAFSCCIHWQQASINKQKLAVLKQAASGGLREESAAAGTGGLVSTCAYAGIMTILGGLVPFGFRLLSLNLLAAGASKCPLLWTMFPLGHHITILALITQAYPRHGCLVIPVSLKNFGQADSTKQELMS